MDYRVSRDNQLNCVFVVRLRLLCIFLSNNVFLFFYFAVVVTTAPNNEAELQLYRVLQRASLLAYYDTLLEMGKHINNLLSHIEIIENTIKINMK